MVADSEMLSASFADHDVQEELVRSSGLDWTIIRPTRILDIPATGTVSVGRPLAGVPLQISKHDVADFIVQVAVNGGHTGEAVLITN
jgi:uncharacterized protein YbjT (DUF2867 family)